jgi:type II secretory pathway pseudopilin PulG
MAEIGAVSGNKQRGITLVGLIVVLAMFGMVGIVALKVVPTYLEYLAVKKAIVGARTEGQNVRDIQVAFDKRANVGYIESISGKDLVIVRNGNNEFDVSFAYDKKIPLVGPASLLMEYEGTTATTSAKKTIE